MSSGQPGLLSHLSQEKKKERKKANTDCMPKLKRDWKKIKHLWVSRLLNHESSFIPFLKILFNVIMLFFTINKSLEITGTIHWGLRLLQMACFFFACQMAFFPQPGQKRGFPWGWCLQSSLDCCWCGLSVGRQRGQGTEGASAQTEGLCDVGVERIPLSSNSTLSWVRRLSSFYWSSLYGVN